MKHTPFLVLHFILILTPFNAYCQSNFGFLGGHIGYIQAPEYMVTESGGAIDSNNSFSYGGDALYLFNNNGDSLAFGGSVAYTRAKFEVDDRVKGDLIFSYWGFAPLMGKVQTSADGSRSAMWIGYEFGSYTIDVDLDYPNHTKIPRGSSSAIVGGLGEISADGLGLILVLRYIIGANDGSILEGCIGIGIGF